MEFLDCLWLDAERGIGKTQLQTKLSNPRSIFHFLLQDYSTGGGIFQVQISSAFGADLVLFGGMKPLAFNTWKFSSADANSRTKNIFLKQTFGCGYS